MLMLRPSSSRCRFSSRVPNRVTRLGLISILFFIQGRGCRLPQLGARFGCGFPVSGMSMLPVFAGKEISLKWNRPERAPAGRGWRSFELSVARAGRGSQWRQTVAGRRMNSCDCYRRTSLSPRDRGFATEISGDHSIHELALPYTLEMKRAVRSRRKVYGQLLKHARRQPHRECCGILAGRTD